MSDQSFEGWLRRLFVHPPPRADDHSTSLSQPSEPLPLLAQGGPSLGTLAVALQLLEVIHRHQGARLAPGGIDPLLESLKAGFSESEWSHVEEEVLRILFWLEGAFSAPGETEDEPREIYDEEDRELVIRETLQSARDLFLEFRNRDSGHLYRARIRPHGLEMCRHKGGPDMELEESPLLSLVGQRIPDGLEMSIALQDIRWLMPIKRLSRITRPTLARVLSFPFGGDADDPL